MEGKQKRIFLWTCPRSLSTAFYRAITNAPGTLGILEPYGDVYGYVVGSKAGPRTLEGIIEKLKQPFPDYKTIFVKDMAYCLVNKTAKIEDLLPDGYIHTFLIRDPRKSVPSLYKMFTHEGSKAVMTTYCEFVGIDFNPSMCNWNLADPSRLEAFKAETGDIVQVWYKTATTTSAFIGNNGHPTLDLSSQPLIVQETVAENMPYYELMYAKRALIQSSR